MCIIICVSLLTINNVNYCSNNTLFDKEKNDHLMICTILQTIFYLFPFFLWNDVWSFNENFTDFVINCGCLAI